ncbi:MAG: CehA/McbA family metallohydrolase [Phycisphaerales bacterium]|nr:MAG: CehA/McbA family metallohydrolase [Phycisphaerales bacterium]
MEMKISRNAMLFTILVQLLLATFAAGQIRREVNFPDILGYKTLKCDFHMHTVFSDGTVWPTVRVDEAWREGLDVISITDHIEYQPHKQDVPTNFNRSYEIARPGAREKNILLIKGAEITRETPPGHFNVLYLEDIDPLDTEDLIDAAKAADAQKAFIFWNHPGWKPEHKGWFDIHTQLYENKLMHGIEVANGGSYYREAHQWALEKNLTMMGNSDIHQPALERQTTTENHRTMTLVFARERTAEAVKEALTEGRTAVWFQNQLIGRSRYLEAIFRESIEIGKPHHRARSAIWVTIRNHSAVDVEMDRTGSQGPAKLALPANATTLLKCGTEEGAEQLKLSYVVRNFLIAPDKGLPVDLTIDLR